MAHVPVLCEQVLASFRHHGRAVRKYLDLTAGLGGHACEVWRAFQPHDMVLCDRDPTMLLQAQERLHGVTGSWRDSHHVPHLSFHHVNYSQVDTVVPLNYGADAILMDLGVASPHFDVPERGLSILRDGPLDMRLDQQAATQTASDIVNEYSEAELGRIFRDFANERHWRAVARGLVAYRRERNAPRLERTKQLVDVLEPILGRRTQRVHPATRIFQALRIEVNQELHHLKQALPKVFERLQNPGGVMCVISFHSAEDELVKQFCAECCKSSRAQVLNKKPIIADQQEVNDNQRARSAKLRTLLRTN